MFDITVNINMNRLAGAKNIVGFKKFLNKVKCLFEILKSGEKYFN